jgi:DNA-3-methyladenine glycosylase
MLERLAWSFFRGRTPDVAKRILGCRLVRVVKGERLAGIVVEVEAYLGKEDPASHAYRGMTPRNRVMFGEAGHAYVYFTMGMHWCLNVTTERVGRAGAVLIRALEPTEGLETMMRNRGMKRAGGLTDGPAKLTQALGIDGRMNGEDLAKSRRLFLERGRVVREIGSGARVGISRGLELEWRFFDEESGFVSKKKPAA